MKTFFVVSCLVLAITAEPQGYTYEKPNNDGLSVSLLLPPSQNQQIPSSFPVSFTKSRTGEFEEEKKKKLLLFLCKKCECNAIEIA